MPSPDQSPVLIAWSALEQRSDDYKSSLEAAGLMVQAARTALPGAAGAEILRQVDWIGAPEGMTRYADPARLVGDAIGASGARTILAKLGVMQQTLISKAIEAVVSGEFKMALVCGGEAKHRDLRARLANDRAVISRQPAGVEPDETWKPKDELILACEAKAGLRDAVGFYAIMESFWRARHRQTLAESRAALGELYARFTAVAARNPHANRREILSPDDIAEDSPGNPMLAFPYTKRMVSAWTVDQAAALFFCTVETARALGVPESQWVFPLAGIESNHMPPLTTRVDLTRAAAMAIMAQAGAEATALPLANIDHLDLYSCFPVAVKMAAEGLGVAGDRDLTLTGGMPFAGGPLNNYVFQTTCRAADLLRAAQAPQTALVSCVSGLYTKQGFTIWGSSPPARPYQFVDVTEAVAAAEKELPVIANPSGSGVIVGYTVMHHEGRPQRAIAVIELEGGRTTASSENAALMAALLADEGVGAKVLVSGDEFSLL